MMVALFVKTKEKAYIKSRLAASVTRFGEISPLWSNVKSLWQVLRVNLIFGKVLNLLWLIFRYNTQIFIAENGNIIKINLAFWSH